MVGITSYGAYIPWNRLNRKIIYQAMGWYNTAVAGFAKGEKAVANYDEDSITMATAAGMDCISGLKATMGKEINDNIIGNIDGLYLASTTHPYQERQNARIVASALGFSEEMRTADFTGSLKSGTTGLLSASEAIRSDQLKNAMICIADCRLGKAGSMQEYIFGDGAVSFLLGKDNVIAEIEGFYTLSNDFIDHRRMQGDKFDQAWEDRWMRDEGYARVLPEIITGILKKYNLNVNDLSKIIYPCHYDKLHSNIAKKLNAESIQIQDNMFWSVGDTGTAHPLLMLAAALEKAEPGDRLLVVSYGNGGDALIFRVTEEIEKFKAVNKSYNLENHMGVEGHLLHRNELDSYEKYAAFRNILPVETGIRGEVASTAISVLWREQKTVLGLEGSLCKRCGTPQYPPQKICINPQCQGDKMVPYRFADKKGYIFSYTADNLAYSPDPPAVYGIVDFEGGGRFWFDFTDCDPQKIKVGIPVKMSFRRKYIDEMRSMCGYFWKAIPVTN